MARNGRRERYATDENVRKVYAELVAEGIPRKSRISRVAQRIGYSRVGAARFVNRLGLQRSKA